jgi:hypothetical protein
MRRRGHRIPARDNTGPQRPKGPETTRANPGTNDLSEPDGKYPVRRESCLNIHANTATRLWYKPPTRRPLQGSRQERGFCKRRRARNWRLRDGHCSTETEKAPKKASRNGRKSGLSARRLRHPGFAGLPNSAKTPSPAVFAMRPLCSPTSLSRIARRSVNPLSVPTFVSAHETAVALHICCEDCDEASGDCRRI